MSKTISRGATSTASSATQKSQMSSISKSAFAPSHLQLSLFASVIQGFESQHLRIHDTTTGRLRCEHAAAARARITSLAWGYYGTSYRESQQNRSQKKRKRNQGTGEHVVVAYGLSTSEISMFSPAEGKVVGTLSGVHERGIKDFQFVLHDQSQGWSLGGDAKLVRWDLASNTATRTILLPDSSISILASPALAASQILCASPTPYTISFDENEQPKIDSFDSFKNAIHTLFRSSTDEAHTSVQFLAADNDRYINVYDSFQKRLTKTLIAGSEVDSVDFYTPSSSTKTVLSEQLLAVVTREGLVELFPQPFIQKTSVNGDLKSKRKNLTSKASAKVKLVTPNSTKAVPIFKASFQGPDLVVATAEGGVDVTFQKVRWQDEGNGELLFDGVKEFKHNKTASTFNTVIMNGAKEIGKSHVDESNTVVVNGDAYGSSQNAAIEIESSDDDKETSGGESEDEEESDGGGDVAKTQESGESGPESDQAMEDAADVPASVEDEEMADGTPEEPSFGELLARKHPETISITDALHPESSTLVQIEDNRIVSIPSGVSLSTVLTQSLRTNDHNLLESCLHNTDGDIIKNTIQRLNSSLAGILLQKLAERLASRPGRYGHLLIWVQWTCIVHGGAVAGRPEVFSKISTLYGVLSQRAKSLDSLLLLKGKLDMLDAQLAFRRDIQSHREARRGHGEANVIYVDEDDNWSSDEDEVMDARPAPSRSKKPKKALKQLVEESDSEETSDDDEAMPAITNGVNSDSDEEGSEDDESESEADVPIQKSKAKPANKFDAIIDDEAEESHPSDEESASSDDEEDSDEEADSEMDDFINDDSIDEEVVEDDVIIEGDDSAAEAEEILEKPKKKKLRTA